VSDNLADISTLRVNGDLKISSTGLVEEGGDKPALALKGLTLSGLTLDGATRLGVNEVRAEGIKLRAIRTGQGIIVAGLPRASAEAEVKSVEAATGDIPPSSGPPESQPFRFRIDRVLLRGDNRITFVDKTVKPKFENTITLTEAELRQLDSSMPGQATSIHIKGKNDDYASFAIEGESKPFAPELSLDLKAKLGAVAMPPTSPYLVQLLGYRINTGQLNSDISLQVEKNSLDSVISLNMKQLQLQREDPERIAASQGQTALPLNTALSLLRDKNDNIKLKLPISGKLDDPKFNINDIINVALGKALKAGSVSYLKYLLQPYGSLITIVQLADKAGGKIQLDPVMFSEGSAALSVESHPYLERIYRLPVEKGVNIRLCGFATTADLVAISKGKETIIPAPGHTVLENLAAQRAESIKSYLIEVYGVQPDRLFICHPELDRDSEAQPRVELSI
jgi:hypothetical protein